MQELFNTEIGTDLEKAAALLNNKELVAVPTETVYGLAANALNEVAVAKIFAAKKRPLYNPLIVHLKSIEELEKYAKEIPDAAFRLFEAFSPGPLTVILPKNDIVPDITTAGKDNVALRIPNHPLTLELLSMLDFPLAAPSANPFGYISPTTAQHVYSQLKSKIPYILDGGPCESGLESTVIGFNGPKAYLHRLGALCPEALREIIPDISFELHDNNAPVAPGMLKQHYSPNTKMIFSDKLHLYINEKEKEKIAVISFKQSYEGILPENLVILSPSGNLNEAAQKLYAALHYLDSLQLDLILVERMPNSGIGAAMNDRLERAAAKYN
jgi:L-threonylcarbamoyladenylate synthase